LLDINVILDLLLNRAPFANDAEALWEANRAGRFLGYISAISPPTIYYIGRRRVGADAARQGVRGVLSALRVCPVNGADPGSRTGIADRGLRRCGPACRRSGGRT
jgi:hypothetical protein